MTRQHFPTDYDAYAATYARVRSAAAWVMDPLEHALRALPPHAAVLELGCGTGNYVRGLAERQPAFTYVGLDRSKPMLDEAQLRPPHAGADGGTPYIRYTVGDAARDLPFRDFAFALAYAVDVIQHVDDVARFFREAHRVLCVPGRLIVVTDSEATLRRRSLTLFFPELLSIELARYPALSLVHEAATRAGFRLLRHDDASGETPITPDFVERLAARCSSAMRLIDPADHAAGIARVVAAQQRGESWLSCYDVLHYERTDKAAIRGPD